ncbi:MAG: hypothetical protein ABI112_10145, partial [Terracoccus sp.]
AIDLVIHVSRRGSVRRVAQIATVVRRNGVPCVVPAASWAGPGTRPHRREGWADTAQRLGLEDVHRGVER